MMHAKAATKNVAESPETPLEGSEADAADADRDSGRRYPVAAWKRGWDVHVRGTLGVLGM